MALAKLDGRGIVIALISTATWATAGIFIRWLPGWSPFAILSGRFLVATIVLLPVVLSPNIRGEFLFSLRSLSIWGLSLPLIGGFLLGTAAFQIAPVGEITLLLSTPPIFVVAYKLLAKVRIRRREGIGTLLAIAGVALILLPQRSLSPVASGTSLQAPAGYLFALSAAALLAVYTLWFGATLSSRQNVQINQRCFCHLLTRLRALFSLHSIVF